MPEKCVSSEAQDQTNMPWKGFGLRGKRARSPYRQTSCVNSSVVSKYDQTSASQKDPYVSSSSSISNSSSGGSSRSSSNSSSSSSSNNMSSSSGSAANPESVLIRGKQCSRTQYLFWFGS